MSSGSGRFGTLAVPLFGLAVVVGFSATIFGFYRGRYDATRTLDAFTARLSGDVDLDSVRTDLIGVLHETVRPSHASVWLRDSRG